MAGQLDFSENNVQNSIAMVMATQLISAGYLIYWWEQDAVQTPDGWYGAYTQGQAKYLTDTGFKGRFTAAKGLVTLRGKISANPTFLTRPNLSGVVGTQDQILVPAFAITVSPPAPITDLELGTKVKWRIRHLQVYGFARTKAEQAQFADYLMLWFDEHETLDVKDHTGGTLATLGSLAFERPSLVSDIDLTDIEPATYAVDCNVQLSYVA